MLISGKSAILEMTNERLNSRHTYRQCRADWPTVCTQLLTGYPDSAKMLYLRPDALPLHVETTRKMSCLKAGNYLAKINYRSTQLTHVTNERSPPLSDITYNQCLGERFAQLSCRPWGFLFLYFPALFPHARKTKVKTFDKEVRMVSSLFFFFCYKPSSSFRFFYSTASQH